VFGTPSFAAAGGYLDGSTKGFVLAVRTGATWPSCGVDDAQANCVARLPPIVAAFAGDAALLPAVADMVRVTQSSDTAVAWGTAAARVLEQVILGATPAAAARATIAALQVRWPDVPVSGMPGIKTVSAEALVFRAQHLTLRSWLVCFRGTQDPARQFRTEQDAEVARAMSDAVALADESHAAAVTQLGRNCHLPGALQSPIHALVCAHPLGAAGELQAAVLNTIVQVRCGRASALHGHTFRIASFCVASRPRLEPGTDRINQLAPHAGRLQRIASRLRGRVLRGRARPRRGAAGVARKVSAV
jgi:hypothetical protein